ncbi:lipopolysaccharide biosynthesis protein [Luteibaculum oceani]|uniref:Oligosaccharide flippase family protein n=1 Tax=Luteibaculum oceani TaxID=1294296 RepID=A0A5C6VD14_9FLAO|nr:polysaccharide biosynthesis C-terminal domain-containing protein [Luteibaculum oceani]TXC81525.1 oligosaccharide flippase family protein [Luteibaculum oceani]
MALKLEAEFIKKPTTTISMAQIRRQSTKNAIYIYLGAGLGLASNLLFTRYLSLDENGVLALVFSFGAVIASFSNLGFTFAGVRYFPEMRSVEKHHHGYLYQSLLLGCGAAVVMSLGFYLTKDFWISSKNDLFHSYYWYVGIVALALTAFNAISSYMRFNFNTTTPTLAKEFLQRFLFIIGFIPVMLGLINFQLYVMLYVLVVVFISIALFLFVKQKGYLYLGNYFKELSHAFKRKFRQACVYGVLTGLGSSALLYLDSIMINSLMTTADVGIYVRNFYFATIILMASRAVQGISQTHISESFAKNDLNAVKDVYYKACLVQTVIGLLFFLGIWGNINNVYRIIPDTYSPGMYVILVVGIGNLVNMMTGANQLVLAASPYYKINTYTMFILVLLAIALNFWLIPLYGITGAAIATASSTILFNLMRSAVILIKYQFQPYNYKYLLLFAFAAFAYYLAQLMPVQDQLIVDLALRSFILGASFILPVYLFKISPDINTLIEKLLAPILRRF